MLCFRLWIELYLSKSEFNRYNDENIHLRVYVRTYICMNTE